MTFKRGKMSRVGWREGANGGALVGTGQVQVGAKGRLFGLCWRVVVGKL